MLHYFLFGSVTALSSLFLKNKYPSINNILNLIYAKIFTSAMEKICLNGYFHMIDSEGLKEKYAEFKRAFEGIDINTQKNNLEPYRMASMIVLQYDIEAYKALIKPLFDNLKGI